MPGTHEVVRLTVQLTPRGGSDRIDGIADGVLRLRVAAPPVDGSANEAMIRVLAAELGIPRSALRIVSGISGRRKTVEIAHAEARRALAARWPELGH